MRAQCIINININDLQTWFIIEQIPITVRKFTQKNHLPPIATAVLFFTNSSETGSSMCPLSNGTTQPTSIAWDPTAILNLQPHVHNWDLTYLWNRYLPVYLSKRVCNKKIAAYLLTGMGERTQECIDSVSDSCVFCLIKRRMLIVKCMLNVVELRSTNKRGHEEYLVT